MELYHRTSKLAFNSIQSSGRIVPKLCREMFHPSLSAQEGSPVYKPALWAFHEPVPRKWEEFKSDSLDLRELFRHTSRKGEGLLLKLTLPDNADVWVADWAEHLKDIEQRDDQAVFDSPLYHASMRKYFPGMDMSDIALPEIICFGHIPAAAFETVPLPSHDI